MESLPECEEYLERA